MERHFRFKVFKPATGRTFPVEVEYSNELPDGGCFSSHGMSAIENVQVTGIRNPEVELSDLLCKKNANNLGYRKSD